MALWSLTLSLETEELFRVLKRRRTERDLCPGFQMSKINRSQCIGFRGPASHCMASVLLKLLRSESTSMEHHIGCHLWAGPHGPRRQLPDPLDKDQLLIRLCVRERGFDRSATARTPGIFLRGPALHFPISRTAQKPQVPPAGIALWSRSLSTRRALQPEQRGAHLTVPSQNNEEVYHRRTADRRTWFIAVSPA